MGVTYGGSSVRRSWLFELGVEMRAEAAMNHSLKSLTRTLGSWAAATPENRELLESITRMLQDALAVNQSATSASTDSNLDIDPLSTSPQATTRKPNLTSTPYSIPISNQILFSVPVSVPIGPKPIQGPKLADWYARDLLNQTLSTEITHADASNGFASDSAHNTSPLREPDSYETLDTVILAKRFQIKSRCCDFLLKRAAHLRAGGVVWDFKEPYESLRADASVHEAWMWMLVPADVPIDEPMLEQAREVYINASLVMGLVQHADPSVEVLELVAEAQSAVRALAEEHDRDQAYVFYWLRAQTDRRRVYLKRHMSDASRADPANWNELRERIQAILAEQAAHEERARQLKKPVQRAAWCAKKITQQHAKGFAIDLEDWHALAKAALAYADAGGSLDSRELSDAVDAMVDCVSFDHTPPATPHATPDNLYRAETSTFDTNSAPDHVVAIESLPEPLPHVLALANARRIELEGDADALRSWERSPSPELAKVRAYLQGHEIVLVGGSRRPKAEANIIAAFGLSGLRWAAIGEHKSLEHFRPDAARREVKLVLGMIRFMSHSYDEIREECKRQGKLYARLKSGYSPNQIATQVWEQLSDQITESHAGNGTSTA